MKNIHFIAIGGAIMHQLAIALQKKGKIITGSDDAIQDPAKTNLATAGLLPENMGWFPEKITSNLDAVVLGMHARLDNPELVAAQKMGIPIYSFPQFVYEYSKEKKRVVIAGSHGKTTITSMVMHVLKAQGIDFDYLVGAKLPGFTQSVQLSDAPLIILEGDEYPASPVEKKPKIFFYHPHISVISGIAWDHINVFPTYDNYFSQFTTYLNGMETGTKVIYNYEDAEVVRAISEPNLNNLVMQSYQTPIYRYADDGTPILTTDCGDIALSVFGKHNFSNIEAARGVCNALGVSNDAFYNAIATFTGAARRLERMLANDRLVVYRDFAHAPSKLKATLNAVREAHPKHKFIAVFELHTFSSLNEAFLKEYKHAMNGADEAVVYFSSHALQIKGLPPLNPEMIINEFDTPNLQVYNTPEALTAFVTVQLTNSNQPICLLLMSSGTFDEINWNQILLQKNQK